MSSLIAPSEFVDLDEHSSYLYTGANAPTLRTAHRAMADAYALQSRGPAGREALLELERRTRGELAELAGTTVDRVGLAGDASTLWNSVASGFTWAPGDNVILNDLEHPALYYPFLAQRRHGLQTRFVQHDEHWEVPVERIMAACDEHTRAVAVSSVSYVNSYRHDLEALARATRRAGIALLIDWSHSFGVQPIDPDLGAIGVCASYKWLLGPYGVGIVITNPDADLDSGQPGWRSTVNMFDQDRFDRLGWHRDAQRFQLGAASFAAIAALGAGVARINRAGIDAVATHSRRLTQEATDRALAEGLTVLSPQDAERRGGSVVIACPDGEGLAQILAQQGILAWGGDGRIRASYHAFNHEREVDAFVAAVRTAIPADWSPRPQVA